MVRLLGRSLQSRSLEQRLAHLAGPCSRAAMKSRTARPSIVRLLRPVAAPKWGRQRGEPVSGACLAPEASARRSRTNRAVMPNLSVTPAGQIPVSIGSH